MIYAQIKDNVIQNVIKIADESLVEDFIEGFDSIIRIDGLDPMPHIGWKQNGDAFEEDAEWKQSQEDAVTVAERAEYDRIKYLLNKFEGVPE